MRVAAICLPELRIELVRSMFPDLEGPVAVVVAPPPLTERDLLGNTRLSVVSREARALGVAPGQTIAQARARAGDLAVRVVRPDAVKDMLARIAEVGLAFGATVSFAGDPRDLVWIDVTGCAHLHARSGSTLEGEHLLASRLAGAVSSLGHVCFVAVADGPRVAAMLASAVAESAATAWEKAKSRPRSRGALPVFEPLVVPPGENAIAIAPLPISALPLAPEDVRWLAKLGVRTIEGLRALPKDGLAARLGPRAREVLSLAAGEDRAPLHAYVPPEVPEEEATLEYGIEGTQALTFVAKTLCDRLAARLQGRAVAAARVELELKLDAAMVAANDAGADRAVVALDLPAPLSGAGDLLAALRPKIERLVLAAPVLAARLRAPVLVPRRAAALSLFEPQPKAERALPRLVGELVSDLGAEAVSVLTVGDSWSPDGRSRLVPFGSSEAKAAASLALARSPKKRRKMLASVPEPTRLLAEPRPIAKEDARVLRHLSRVEAIEWWKTAPQKDGEARRPVDYVQAWTDDGAAFVEIDRASGAMRVRGWFD
ncbi:MAG: DNA polymerase Y family protein [Labilithrix sp.]|nr:DNA polymerase Y family protein [Labilithrix sp.]MCW5814382.1 DNA polymerase Y family protein [Labilithrix sp.]